jgi:hypothetical protein
VAVGHSVHHYLRVEITGWRLRLEAVDLEGRVVDEVNLAPPPELAQGGVISAFGERIWNTSSTDGADITLTCQYDSGLPQILNIHLDATQMLL